MQLFSDALQYAQPWLERYGYLAVFVGLFLEGVGVPAPGVLLMIAAGVAAAQGEMSWALLFIVALAAACGGLQTSYWLGVAGGQHLLRRLPFFKHGRYRKIERLFERWGVAIVVIAPLLDGLRQLNGYASGVAGMRWRRFALANLVGCLIYTGLWLGLSYVVGLHADALYDAVAGGSAWWYIGAGILFAALIVSLFWYERRHHKDGRGKRGGSGAAA